MSAKAHEGRQQDALKGHTSHEEAGLVPMGAGEGLRPDGVKEGVSVTEGTLGLQARAEGSGGG